MADAVPGLFNYWVAVALFTAGLLIVLDSRNMVKKLVGLNVFQSAVFLLFITLGKIEGGRAPILAEGVEPYSNPLPHVLILTAIVVGVATTAVGLALVSRIRDAYGTVHEDEIHDKPHIEPEIMP
ncbi:MAG: cation:proton antiporter subunit C [Gammaproteobacteria bacterium]|nr:cation:proton antiporter subunit C [Gammaproteobacteria bacterium]MYD76981.1 cation:proton antiporter subunit C [Gammaproteobacteria bacterium]MYJ51557.1 cation:proton antiporter subunit C [Gammaproteobacteria bacterium]